MSETKIKWQPTEEQRVLLLALQEECAKESSVAVFARKFLPYTRSKYDQIMDVFDPKVTESYFDRVSPSVIERLFVEIQFLLDEIPLKRVQLARIKEFKIVETTKIAALKQAVTEAKSKVGPERLIIVLGPTGAGKTVACNYLQQKVNARFVEVRDIWRHSTRGNVPLGDICKGVGMRSWSGRVATAQDELVKFCGELDIVIGFDEGEHFGAAALNLLKFLLNKTRLVPVIFVVPEMYDKWFAYFPNEASQIARRTHAIIDCSLVDVRDVALFFPENQFANPAAAFDQLAKEANKFGHFSLVRRVAEKLEGVKNATGGSKESDLGLAVAAAMRQMKRENATIIPTKG